MKSTRKLKQATSAVPNISHVLVVWKKTYLMQIQAADDKKMLALIDQGHPSVSKVVQSHKDHEATLACVIGELDRRGISFVSISRERLQTELRTHRYDLVITIGGDGTVLDVSHNIRGSLPVLGVNSATCSSHGHFCVAKLGNFPAVLADILSGKRQPLAVTRLQLTLDGKSLPELVLNEVLIAHTDIGETSRYTIGLDGIEEEQKSDGLFFGPASGSTGWMRSYGCTILPADSRQYEFLVRGLITVPGRSYQLPKGQLHKGNDVRVMSLMPAGKLFIDGRHISYDFPRGSDLRIAPAQRYLRLFIDAATNDRYLPENMLSVAAPAQPAPHMWDWD